MGATFSISIGSFAGYHLYLVSWVLFSLVFSFFENFIYINYSTNQTTLENTTPFMILRYLPPLPQIGHSLSNPPLEPELSYDQRKLVRDAHGHILLYDLGFKKNWAQVFGWNRRFGWLYRLWCGGSS
jgi:palmitoyltransferase ZDHHC2/15/20